MKANDWEQAIEDAEEEQQGLYRRRDDGEDGRKDWACGQERRQGMPSLRESLKPTAQQIDRN